MSSTRKTMDRRTGLGRRVLPLLIAMVMVLSLGFVPQGQSHGAIPTVNSAKLPTKYKTGYTVYKCIDISAWQGVITKSQFKKLKKEKGITHVIVRVGYTKWASFLRFKDKYYKQNIDNAYAAGMKVGAYYYSQAKSVSEAKAEARKTIKLLADYKKKITLPVAFDWEWGGRLNASWAKKNGKAANTKICQAYCDKIKSAGYKPMIYASSSVLVNYLDRDTLHSKYKIWVAAWTYGKATTYSKPMYMWQFSDSGRFGKALTNTDRVDVNYLFVKKNGKWVAYSDGRYRYLQDGVYLTSQWLTLNGKKYYLDKNGYRLQDAYQKIGSYSYGFDGEGVMYKSKTVTIAGNTYKFAKNGRSIQYKMRVTDADGGYLNRRSGPGSSYAKQGKYVNGDTFYVVRTKGDWVQDTDGYWCVSQEKDKSTGEKKPCLEIIKSWPQ